MDDAARKPTLRLEKQLAARREDVFAACVEPDRLATWWGPRGFTTPRIDLDVRVGGAYRIAMQPPDGELFHLQGRFRDVDRPRRLSYTFVWEPPDPDDRETVVTLSFLETPEGGTSLVVEQERFATEERCQLHRDGWTDSLDRLEDTLARAR
jgi:uncharacterized protein YndB with AHSA1/START domain